MAVVGVLAEADVADHAEAGVGVLERSDGVLDDAIRRVGLAAQPILARRQAEQEHRGNAKGPQLSCFASQLERGDGPPLLTPDVVERQMAVGEIVFV